MLSINCVCTMTIILVKPRFRIFTFRSISEKISRLPADTPLQKSDRRSIQQETQPSSPSLSCLDVMLWEAVTSSKRRMTTHATTSSDCCSNLLDCHCHLLASISLPCFRLTACWMSSLDVSHHQICLYQDFGKLVMASFTPCHDV